MKLLMRAVPAAAAAVLLGALAACGSGPPAPGASASGGATIPLLRVGTTNPTSTLNPLTTQGCATDYCGLFMERLMKFSSDNTLRPDLATSMTQPNPVTYVYQLRHGVTFWDGHPMTSADVVYSLDYQEKPGSETATYYTDVKSIAANGPDTVVITLKQPNASFPFNMAYEGVIFEKSFAEAHSSTLGNPGVLIQGTGPWEVDSFDPTTGIELSANPHWWGGKVPVQHISFKFFATETSEALAMRSGEIDAAFPQNGEAFASASGVKPVSWLNNEVGYFGMNTKLAPWNDINVRRAVAYALNRPDIIAAFGGAASAVPVYGFFPALDLRTLGSQTQVNALLSALPSYSFNLAAARQDMKDSAYPHGFTASMDTCAIGNFVDVDQVIAAELQQIGITLKVKSITCGAWTTEIYGPKTFGPMFTTIHSSSIDPSGLSAYLLGSQAVPAGGLNFADYDPASVDALLTAGVTNGDPAQRLSIYGQVLKNLAANIPYVPLFQANAFLFISGKFTLPALGVDTFEIPWALNVKPA